MRDIGRRVESETKVVGSPKKAKAGLMKKRKGLNRNANERAYEEGRNRPKPVIFVPTKWVPRGLLLR